jgi:hypothetical protein
MGLGFNVVVGWLGDIGGETSPHKFRHMSSQHHYGVMGITLICELNKNYQYQKHCTPR